MLESGQVLNRCGVQMGLTGTIITNININTNTNQQQHQHQHSCLDGRVVWMVSGLANVINYFNLEKCVVYAFWVQ